MSDQFSERLSEFVDDEMSVEECEFFVRRLQLDEESRQRFLRYQLIGAAVRGEHIHHNAADLTQRLHRAIESDSATGNFVRSRKFSRTRFATVAGLAAGLALITVFGFGLTKLDFAAFSSRDSAIADNGADAVVPGSSAEAQQLARTQAEVTGIQLLIHHTGYSSGLNRTIMHSSVVAGRGEELAALTEAGLLD